MRIRAAIDKAAKEGCNFIVQLITDHADGYGEAAYFPSEGYDWSGIRDSSEDAIISMDNIALTFWGKNPWPWENL